MPLSQSLQVVNWLSRRREKKKWALSIGFAYVSHSGQFQATNEMPLKVELGRNGHKVFSWANPSKSQLQDTTAPA